MQFVIARSRFAPLLVAALAFGGCSGSVDRPATYPVEGQVAYNNKPLDGATVSFWAEGSARAATGTTDKDGKFTLSTFEINDGAIPGEHKVTISKPSATANTGKSSAEAKDPADVTNMYRETMKSMAKEKPVLPTVYSNPTTTTLKAEVKAGNNEPFVFQLAD